MKIATVLFDNILDEEMRDYPLLCKVFEYSVKKHMPDVDLDIIKIPPPKKEENKEYFQTKNTVKLKYWVDTVKASDDNIIIMDCDMLVLNSITDAFSDDFDLGYTVRKSKIPYNGGMLFVKPTKRSIQFFEMWQKINQHMYDSIGTEDDKLYMEYRAKYAGMNQASYGWMMEHYERPIDFKQFPCIEWNICQEDWARYDPDTARCLHVKSKLRQMCLSNKLKHPRFIEAYATWQEYKKEALKQESENNE